MQIKVVACSEAGHIIAVDPQWEFFFVLKRHAPLPIDLGDILEGDISDEGNTWLRIRNINKQRSVDMTLDGCNCALSGAIELFVEALEAPKFRTSVYAGKECFISNTDNIAVKLERELVGSKAPWG
ncbi:MAG: hypothetical protein ABSA83_10975 [Verrucomicrobiota bacterium]|jgi:hypothetical protein